MRLGRLSIGGEIILISILAILVGLGGKVVRQKDIPVWGSPTRVKLIDLPEAAAEPLAENPDSLFAPSDAPYRILLARAAGLYLQREKLGICFLDARLPELYAQGHIAGALNFPREHYDEHRDQLLPLLDKERLIVIYCDSEECEVALELAETLLAEGFGRIAVFEGGWAEWEQSGYPTATGLESE
ncbi:MAG: rhodanese-like domain-containing protein [bacterium]